MAGPPPRTLSVVPVAEALALVRAAPEALGPLVGRPLLAVDVDGADPADLGRLADLTAALPVVTVAVADRPDPAVPAPRCDVLLAAGPEPGPPWHRSPEGIDAALARLAEAVDRAPQAAAVLVQLLRLGRGRSLDDALTLESLAYATLQAGPEHRTWLAARATRPPRPGPGPGLPNGDTESVGLDRRGATLVVTLRRPHVRNAVDVGVRDGLVAAFDLAAADLGTTAVELRGDGPDFCSGGDLDEFGTTPDPTTAHLVRSTRSPARALARARAGATVTTHVHGASIGAGVELAALAHHVRAAPGATFRLPELAMGLVPGAGGTATIPRRIGPELTAWMALTGAVVDAPTALRWGLVDEIAETAEVAEG